MKRPYGGGQFFVEDIIENVKEPIPVDNFVYYTFNKHREMDGREVRLSAVGSRVVVSVGRKRHKYEWFDNYADGLRRMADVLDGTVKPSDFGKQK